MASSEKALGSQFNKTSRERARTDDKMRAFAEDVSKQFIAR
jgi:hypothetical protein